MITVGTWIISLWSLPFPCPYVWGDLDGSTWLLITDTVIWLMYWQICPGYRTGRQCQEVSLFLYSSNIYYQYLTSLQWWGDHRFLGNQFQCLPVWPIEKLVIFAPVQAPFYLCDLECCQLLFLTSMHNIDLADSSIFLYYHWCHPKRTHK